MGKLSDEEYERLDEIVTPKKYIGETLIQKKIITTEELFRALQTQMREIVLNLFPLFEGQYKFQEKKESGLDEFEINLDLASIIEDGIRRLKFNPAIRDFFQRKKFIVGNREFYFRLTDEEKAILQAIEERMSLEEIYKASNLAEEEFWKSLYLIHCLGLVDVVEKEASADKGEAPPGDGEGKLKEDLEEIIRFHQSLEGLNYYQILNVPPSSSPAEMKKAYFRLARKYHPDLYPRDLPAEIKEKIEDVFDAITKAFKTLSDPVKKEEYDKKYESPEYLDGKEIERRAEVKFRQAKTLYNQARYEEAYALLREATRLIKNKGNYFLLMGMTLAKLQRYLKEAEESYLRAIKLEPWNPESYVALGLLYKKEGLVLRAKKQFQRALSLDPDHRVARKEWEELEGLAKKKKTWKDFLSMDVFGKKKKS
jgi:curved DNA-binding protein CbpA